MIRITGILRVAVVICCAATAVSFFGRNWWLFELTTHFRVQYAVALVLAGVLLLALRRFRIAAASMLFALPNVAVIAPIYVPNHSSPTAGSPVKAIFMNLSVTNREYGKAVDLVRSSHPDFLAVAELSPAWLTNLRQHLQDYPHVVSRTRNDQFGIGLFSKTPLERPMIVDLGTLGFPAIKASITSRGRRLTIFVVHPPPPVADLFRDERVTQMQNLAALVVKEKDVVVLGDLNMTPWSPIFRDLLSTTGLEDGRTGFGVQATWPATMPWLLIPVDHCLVSKDLVVRRLAAGSDIGSDHYPVVVEIGLK
jgi:endonuclease/exonuclease/phosphatase (EEP) superfamily protein YafD